MEISQDSTDIQNSVVINKQPTFRLSKRWKGKWQPNQEEIVANGDTIEHDACRPAEDNFSSNTDCMSNLLTFYF